MTDRLNGTERIECRLVIVDSDSMRVLTTAAGAGSSLPCESVPAYTRVAGAFNEAIEQRYGLRTIQLAVLPGTTELISCAVHEIMGLQEQQLRSLSFAALDEVGSNDLTETERSLILKIMMGEANPLGRFARIGWIYELVAKAGGNRDRKSMPVTRQLNQGIDFCLLSLTDASGRKVWFKAVGEPNIHEYALTGELTRRFPSYLPKTVTTTPEWNGWVMEDANGLPLNESGAIYQCEEAFTALAIMQMELATDIASLSAIGAKSWTWSRIAPLLDPFFIEACRAMRAQTSDKSKPLSGGELNQLQRDIKSALDEFMNAGIPETLLHGDIGHGNIIATCEGPIFLDWAEAYIGHPFLTAEYLLADLARSNPMFAEKQAALRSHYASHWKGYVQPSELERIIGLAPAIAAFVYGVITWDANFYRSEPTQAWPLMRSMLRRTKRELERAAEFIA